jgi:GNAT superfamily N-acetyltransferase
MDISQKTIVPLDGAPLEASVTILRRAFGEVTGRFGITEANAPLYTAYTTVAKLEEMRARGALFYGCFLDGRQVGVVALEKRKAADSYIDGYFLERLAVLPEYWHRGVGRELVSFVIERARELGVNKLYLGMVDENAVLKQWYLDMGFIEIEARRFEQLPFTVGFMEMNLP